MKELRDIKGQKIEPGVWYWLRNRSDGVIVGAFEAYLSKRFNRILFNCRGTDLVPEFYDAAPTVDPANLFPERPSR